jgi:hypothetical protein
MSAYLLTPTEIGTLAYAIADRTALYGDAATVAKKLANENLRSVGYRYAWDATTAVKEFLGLKNATTYRRDCQHNANGVAQPSAEELRDLAESYEYQSCQCDDWPDTVAAEMIAVLLTDSCSDDLTDADIDLLLDLPAEDDEIAFVVDDCHADLRGVDADDDLPSPAYRAGQTDAHYNIYAAMTYANQPLAHQEYLRGWNDAWLQANDPVLYKIRTRAA